MQPVCRALTISIFFSAAVTVAFNPAGWGQVALPKSALRETLVEQRAKLDATYRRELESLAERLPAAGSLQQDLHIRLALRDRAADRIYVFLPPAQETVPEDLPEGQRTWWNDYVAARRRQAERLVELARSVVEDRPAWAYQLLHEALWEFPDLENVRLALGYRRDSQGWVYAGQEVMATVGRIAVPDFRLAARKYYQVTTAHFRVLSEASEADSVAFARELERFHCVWRQLFFDFWGRGDLLAQRLARGAPPAQPRREKHLIVWLRDRDKYIDLLKADTPQIDKTLGIYLDRRRAALFFGDAHSSRTTRLHEVTHQLFAETQPTAADIGTRGNVWAIEGVALFMESLEWHDSWAVLGAAEAPRLQYARHRALEEKFYVPASQFARLDRATVQQDANIAALYSQAAGWTHFFMTTEGGAWRHYFVEYLRRIYQGRDQPDTLWQVLPVSPEELDRRYAAFLYVTPQEGNVER